MRCILSRLLVALALTVVAGAQTKTNPATGINWPSGCNVPNYAYNVYLNACVLVNSGGLSGLPTAGGTMTGPIAFTGTNTALTTLENLNPDLNLNSRQANLVGPVIYDHFRYADGTAWSTQIAESGNSQWGVIGGSDPGIVDAHLTPTTVDPSAFYAYLPNTTSVGGTPQPVQVIGGTFKLCPPPSGTYDTTQVAPAIIAADTPGLTKLLHLNMSPTQWSLGWSLTGPGFLVELARGQMALATDCKTEYHVAMLIDQTAGTVQVIPAMGPPSAVITDSHIVSMGAVYGIWESQLAANRATADWGLSYLGGPPDADKDSALGGASGQIPVWALQGHWGSSQWVDPDNVGPTFNVHGVGWYRIATGAALNTYFLDEKVDMTISDPGVAAQHVVFSGYTDNTAISAQLIQTSSTGSSLVDQARVSNDGAGNQALDIHVRVTDALDIAMVGKGIFTPATAYPGGATALTNSKTLTFSNASSSTAFTSTLSGGVGYYTLLTQQIIGSNYSVSGNFSIFADSYPYDQYFNFQLSGWSTTCPTPQQLFDYPTALITKVRCSVSGAGAIQVDVYNSSASAVTLSGTYVGGGTINSAPTVGATPLSGGTTELLLLLNGSVVLSNASVSPQSVDCHAACSPVAAQLSNALISNYGQAASNVQITGPTITAGMNFIMSVGTAQAANYWRYSSTTANIYLDGVSSPVTNIIFASPAIGNSFSCFSFKIGSTTYALKCTTLAGVSTSS